MSRLDAPWAMASLTARSSDTGAASRAMSAASRHERLGQRVEHTLGAGHGRLGHDDRDLALVVDGEAAELLLG